MVEIPGDDAVPPAVRGAEPGGARDIDEMIARVLEEGDGHPFPDNDQVDLAVLVEVGPKRARHQSHVAQARSHAVRHIVEADRSPRPGVVVKYVAARRQGILPRHHPPADEQVELPIAVVVSRHDRRPAGDDPGQRARREREAAVAVVHVQPGLEGGRV